MDRLLPFRRPPETTQRSTLSFISKLFFCLDITQVIVVGSIQITMMLIGDYQPIKDGGMGLGRRLYMVVFACCVIYTCLLCLFAIKLQNFLEIVAFVFQNYLFMCYSFIQVYHLRFKTKYSIPHKFIKNPIIGVLVIVNSIYLVAMNIVFTTLAVKLFQEYGWKIYKKVRFNVNLRGAYHMYELVLCLMKMNLLILAMFSICYNQTVLREMQSTVLFFVTIITIPVGVILGFCGYFGIRKENKTLTVIFILSLFIAMAGYMYAIYKVGKLECFGCMAYFKTGIDLPREVVIHLVYLAILALIFTLALCIATLKAFCNFGKGLKDHFTQTSQHGSFVTLSLGISRNLSEMFKNNPVENTTVTNDAISMVHVNPHTSAVDDRQMHGETCNTKQDIVIVESVGNSSPSINKDNNSRLTNSDVFYTGDSGIQISVSRSDIQTESDTSNEHVTKSNALNNEISSRRDTSDDQQVAETRTTEESIADQSTPPNLAKRGSVAVPQVSLVAKIYNGTFKRLNHFYARRKYLKTSVSLSKVTKYGDSHIPAFSAEGIWFNNGIGVDTARRRKSGVTLTTGITFGDIEEDVLKNLMVNDNGETNHREEKSPKKRPLGYKYSRSELYTVDNIIREVDEENGEF